MPGVRAGKREERGVGEAIRRWHGRACRDGIVLHPEFGGSYTNRYERKLCRLKYVPTSAHMHTQIHVRLVKCA